MKVTRDIAAIVTCGLICYFVISDSMDRAETREAQRTRLSIARNAIDHLDELYKKAVFDESANKGIYDQIFRQNEVLLEYQKLLLTTAYLPLPGDTDGLPTPPPGR